MQNGGSPRKTSENAKGQCDNRHHLRLPEGEGESGHTRGHASDAHFSDRASHAGQCSEQGNGVRHHEDCVGERDEEQQEEADGRVRVGGVLQWQKGGVLHQAETDERR